MNILEKFVFLELTNKQFGKYPNSEYLGIYKNLTEKEKKEYGLIFREIHDVWNRINGQKIEGFENSKVNSIQEYHENISPLSDIIIQVSSDFGITLKNEISDKLKKSIIKIFGEDYFNNNFSQ